jgi:hypothetical protein
MKPSDVGHLQKEPIMTSIRETITSALPIVVPSGYEHHVGAVVEALTERERTFTDHIIDAVAYNFNVSPDEVRTRLEQEGMAVRPLPVPEPEVEEVAAKQGKGKGKGLKSRVKRLEKLAREHGLLSR